MKDKPTVIKTHTTLTPCGSCEITCNTMIKVTLEANHQTKTENMFKVPRSNLGALTPFSVSTYK